MQFFITYVSPLGEMVLRANETALTGAWFLGQKYFLAKDEGVERETPILKEAARWLDEYFTGREPTFFPKICAKGTPFQENVWEILRKIPYGKTTTYGAIAKELCGLGGKMSAQAVGGAVGRNPIGIFIPCHRVLGANGALTGYAGGLDKKVALLELEKVYDYSV